jgi:hypothetical protein
VDSTLLTILIIIAHSGPKFSEMKIGGGVVRLADPLGHPAEVLECQAMPFQEGPACRPNLKIIDFMVASQDQFMLH